MKKETLSIIVPVSNMAGRLQNLESWIYDACDLGIDVILIHDFRDTETSIQLRALVDKSNTSIIRLEERKFGNQGAARNFGIAHSKGEWIMFWDSDDIGSPSIVLQAITHAKTNTDLIIGQYKVMNPTSVVLSKSATTHLRNLPKNVGVWRMAFRSERFKEVQFPELQMAEDQVYFARCIQKAKNIEIVPDSFYSYIQGNSGQITRNSEALKQIPRAIKLLLRLLIQKQKPKVAIIVANMTLRLFITDLKRRFRSV